MSDRVLTLYKKLLFTLPKTTPKLRTYAIIDSARDESLKEEVVLSALTYVDLWHEEMFELEHERPLYLVELQEDSPLLQTILKKHQQSVATYFISPYTIQMLLAYYRMFTYVDIEVKEAELQKGIFGFYDPNILPGYIRTLYTQKKIDEFFAGVAMWLAPSSEDNGLYIAFRDREGVVDDVVLDLSQLIEISNPVLDFDRVSFPTIPNLDDYAHDIVIDYRQIGMFEQMERERFIGNLLEEFKEDGYSLFEQNDFVDTKELSRLFDEAISLKVVSEAGVYRYILINLLLSKPINEFDFFQDLLQESNEDRKIEIMNKVIDDIIAKRIDEDGA